MCYYYKKGVKNYEKFSKKFQRGGGTEPQLGFTLAEVFSSHCAGFRKTAFTLAEVLITLGIIGVVAAMTMPSLITQHKNQEIVARLQKAISVLNNGMGQMMALEGVDQIEYLEFMNICGTNVSSSGEVQACLQPYFKKFFNIVQDNVGVPSSGGDFYPTAEFKFLNGTKNLIAAYWGITQRYAFVTGDGILYVPFTWGFSGNHNALVDINAKKGPNQIGRDIFILKRNGTTFVPAGGETWDDSSSDDYCNPQSGKGYGCSARIMQEGWKIKY